jgi:FtsZ-binding cell division protein ZapB
VEGEASKTTATAWLANSDRRIKTDIQSLENSLEKLCLLNPVTFRYTPEYQLKHPSVEDKDYYNFIAQEYRTVFPEAVKTDAEGLLMIDTHPVTVTLVGAVKELKVQVDALAQQNQTLQTQNEILKEQNKTLTDRLNQLESIVNKLISQ